MYCLYCGDCCKRMSPISQPEPCPNIISVGSFVFCGCYPSRPKECGTHKYLARFCPVGLDILKIDSNNTENMRVRIDTGWEKIKELGLVTPIRQWDWLGKEDKGGWMR